MRGGEIALVDGGYGRVCIEAAAETREAAAALAATLRAALASKPPEPERVPIAFWMRGEPGGDVRHRDIDTESFEQIAGNYSAAVRAALERLIATRAPERGRLILWRGEPGTGKSHALRALARAWAPWCSAHFIMDPEELLGRGGAYMLDVLTWDGDDEDRWRLLILEDAGELIAADARAITGQALPRLLNVTDGLLGQGTRTMLLITTNEPVGRLHPATRRPVAAWPISSSRRSHAARPTHGWRRMDASAGSTARRRWPSCSRRRASRPSTRPGAAELRLRRGPSTNTRRLRAERLRDSAYQFVIEAVTM